MRHPTAYRYNIGAKSSSFGAVVLLTVGSVVLHGLVLALPMPSHQSVQEPELPPSSLPQADGAADVNVTILPSGTLKSRLKTEEPTETASEENDLGESDRPVQSTPPPSPEETQPPEIVPSIDDTIPEELPPEEPDPAMEPVDSEIVPPDELPVDPGNSELSPPTLEEQLQDLTAYDYNESGILKEGEVGTQLLGWTVPGQILPSKADSLEVPYLLVEQCLDIAPEPGVLVAVVNQDGSFQRGPEILTSTGYAILDDQAKAIAESGEYHFPERTETQAYSVPVEVLYPASCL
ncbi:hypothetical protein PN498_18790 [Oscillatoria sp. CS-180]|uniref:hypothetical protein n=1 Tax=Oscillatoria sp. CS-180 TaxID=3021720 RepID=UPI00232AD383|nr:hypothetical protein [Oscillatoria sp. CS-180]MDB9528049.1 hypothetical protein [Oscillatoria sp. CS-180]